MLVQISGEEDLKIDVSYIAYRFFRGSIDNSDCTDQRRCSSLCRGHSKSQQALMHLSPQYTDNYELACKLYLSKLRLFIQARDEK